MDILQRGHISKTIANLLNFWPTKDLASTWPITTSTRWLRSIVVPSTSTTHALRRGKSYIYTFTMFLCDTNNFLVRDIINFFCLVSHNFLLYNKKFGQSSRRFACVIGVIKMLSAFRNIMPFYFALREM